MPLPIRVEHLAMEFRSAGKLVPWVGPALRGVVARTFKESVCVYPVEKRPESCSGCPHLTSCHYGSTFEAGDSVRPIVLAPQYPLSDAARPGDTVGLTLIVLGSATAAPLDSLHRCLVPSGHRGLGDDDLTFDLFPVEHPERHVLEPSWFPPRADAIAGIVPRLSISLDTPLFLKRYVRPGGPRRALERPALSDLVRASVRVMGDLFRAFDRPLEVDPVGLEAVAAEVAFVGEPEYRRFHQPHSPSRHERGYDLIGVEGRATFRDVPMVLIPWLLWGGRLHAGEHRVRGAGGWRVMLD